MRRYTVAFAVVLLVAFWLYTPVPRPDVPLDCGNAACSANLTMRITAALLGAWLGATIGSVADALTHKP